MAQVVCGTAVSVTIAPELSVTSPSTSRPSTSSMRGTIVTYATKPLPARMHLECTIKGITVTN